MLSSFNRIDISKKFIVKKWQILGIIYLPGQTYLLLSENITENMRSATPQNYIKTVYWGKIMQQIQEGITSS